MVFLTPRAVKNYYNWTIKEDILRRTFPIILPAFPLINSKLSGFFFWGINELPVENASERVTKPNSALEYKMRSSAKRLKWHEVKEHQNKYSADLYEKKKLVYIF